MDWQTLGTVLPGGMEIGRRKMMGEWSNGMLCAPGELGLPEVEGVDGLLILAPDIAPPGTPLVDALELTSDVVFDLDITANRPDALCMAGIARDPPTWSPRRSSSSPTGSRPERAEPLRPEPSIGWRPWRAYSLSPGPPGWARAR